MPLRQPTPHSNVLFVTADAAGPFIHANAAAAKPTAPAPSPRPVAIIEPSARRFAAQAEAAMALSGLPAPFAAPARDARKPWDDFLGLTPDEERSAKVEARRMVWRAAGVVDDEEETKEGEEKEERSAATTAAIREAALEVTVARADDALDEDGDNLAALWARGRALLAHGAAHAAVVDLRRLTSALPAIPEQWPEGLDALLRDAHAASRPEGFVMRERSAAYARGAAARLAAERAVAARAAARLRRGGKSWPSPPPPGASTLRGTKAEGLDARDPAAALEAAVGDVERAHLAALGLGQGASDREVRMAFHAHARALHPDKLQAKGLPVGMGGDEGGGDDEGPAAKGVGLAPPPPRGTARTFEEAQEAYEALGRLRGGLAGRVPPAWYGVSAHPM
jgi:hypothetical protein